MVRIVQNNTVIKYLPPLFWDRWRHADLANLTLRLTSMIDNYIATTAAEFLINATDIITNKTINQIQTVGLDKLTVDKITTNSIDTQIITTNSIDASSSNITSSIILIIKEQLVISNALDLN